MPLTVGTDSYVSLADAAAYLSEEGLDPLPSDQDEAEALLKRATRAIDRTYANRFIGWKANTSQVLQWPRVHSLSYTLETDRYFYTVDADGNPRDFSQIPVEIKHATAELAVMIYNDTDIYAQPEPVVANESTDIDGLRSQVAYSNSGYRIDPLYKISLVLRPLLKPSGTVKYVR